MYISKGRALRDDKNYAVLVKTFSVLKSLWIFRKHFNNNDIVIFCYNHNSIEVLTYVYARNFPYSFPNLFMQDEAPCIGHFSTGQMAESKYILCFIIENNLIYICKWKNLKI